MTENNSWEILKNGVTLFKDKKYKEARNLFASSAGDFNTDNQPMALASLCLMAWSFLHQGSLDEGKNLFEQLERLGKGLPNATTWEALAWQGYGAIFYLTGKTLEAQNAYRHSINLCINTPRDDLKLSLQRVLVPIDMSLGDYEESQVILKEIVQKFALKSNTVKVGEALHYLILLSCDLHDQSQATNYLDQLRIMSETSREKILHYYVSLSSGYYGLIWEDIDNSRKQYQYASSILSSIKEADKRITYQTIMHLILTDLMKFNTKLKYNELNTALDRLQVIIDDYDYTVFPFWKMANMIKERILFLKNETEEAKNCLRELSRRGLTHQEKTISDWVEGRMKIITDMEGSIRNILTGDEKEEFLRSNVSELIGYIKLIPEILAIPAIGWLEEFV
ncbi:MAG: tetratricopeptide repeat protein [Candidatus Kariarchaeaceae archaeon]